MRDFIHLRDARAEWMRDGACRNVDDIDFFPETMTTAKAARAVALCNQCPVQEQCARYAMVNEIEYGIWGGLSPRARREIATSRTRHAREKETRTYEVYLRFKGENRNDPVKATARELGISTATVYHHIRIVKFRLIYELLQTDKNGDSATDQTGATKRRRQN
jgi:hypothetical protein